MSKYSSDGRMSWTTVLLLGFGIGLILVGLLGCSTPAKTTVTPATAQFEQWDFTIHRAPPQQPAAPQRPIVNIYVPGAEAVHATTSNE